VFRATSAHLQEDIVVYTQHMVLSLSTGVPGGLSVHSCVPTGHQELWQYHMLHVFNCILLKMSTWGSKHVEENNILWLNNNQCIKLVINVYSRQMYTKVTNLVLCGIVVVYFPDESLWRIETCSNVQCGTVI